MLGELTREDEAHGRLDLARRERAALVVAHEAAGLRRDAVEDVVHERVHDRHATVGDARVGVHLLEDLVDVDREGLYSSSSSFLVSSGLGGFSLGRFLSHLSN